jgi:isoleucyl-tRNA synthetase
LDSFSFHLAGRSLIKFLVDDFSRTYIKLIRDRVSMQENSLDKANCLGIIRHILKEYSKLIAPISPFISEYLFLQLKDQNEPESVHYCDYPKFNEKEVDLDLVANFEIAQKITEAANSLRQELKMKLRWPLEELAIDGDEKVANAVEKLADVIKIANNAEKIVFGENPDYGKKDFEGGSVYMPKGLSENAALLAAFRELTRAIQAERKKGKFVVTDRISIQVHTNYVKFSEYLNGNKQALAMGVGASLVEIKTLESELAGEFEINLDLSELKDGIKVQIKFSKSQGK